MSELYLQGQAPYRGNSEPRGIGGFADTRWTPDAELWLAMTQLFIQKQLPSPQLL